MRLKHYSKINMHGMGDGLAVDSFIQVPHRITWTELDVSIIKHVNKPTNMYVCIIYTNFSN